VRLQLIIAALCALPLAAQGTELGPLAPVAEGKVSCVSPNTAARTCSAMDTYRPGASGEIQDESAEMVSSSPLIIMTTHSRVQVNGKTECSAPRASDITTASFTVEGRPANAAQTAQLRANARAILQPMMSHKLCAIYRPQAEGMLMTFTIDGKALPSLDRHMIWVSPEEGWKVGF
jgi:hypothetical protein